jgi:hypothetical protein
MPNFPIYIHGPNAGKFNTNVPATGMEVANIVNNIPMKLFTALSEKAVRAEMGLPAVPHIVQCTSMGGRKLDVFDDDPLTGELGTQGIDNFTYVLEEAKRVATEIGKTLSVPTISILQGTADRDLARGVWKALAEDVVASWKAIILAETGENPALYFYQTGGRWDTSTDPYNVKLDQLDMAAEAQGTLVTPVYPFAYYDAVHPDVPNSRLMADLFNWARAEKDLGRSWNLIPTATRNGSVITVSVTCRSDETLVLAADDKYGGVGVSNHGFEVSGATITGVSVLGNQVTITTSGGTPTQVRYAFQSQNLNSQTAPIYSAHRGLFRTSLSRTVSGRVLHRWVPSFQLTV